MESAELDQLRERVAQLEVQQQQRDGLMGALHTQMQQLETRVNDRIDGAEARLRSELTKIRNGQESQMEALAALLQRSSDGDGGLPEPERRQQFLRQNRPHMSAKLEGYACGEVKAAGYSLQEIKAAGYVEGLKAARYSLQEVKAAGYSVQEVKAAGYSAQEVKAAGYSAQEVKTAGYSAQEVKTAGYSAKEAADAGFRDDSVLYLRQDNYGNPPLWHMVWR